MPSKPTLLFCIIMDVLGCATYLLPGLGETFDVVFAPISAIIYYFTFKGVLGVVGGSINLIEELLPGTDILPTFTLSWLLVWYKNRDVQKQL